MYSCVYLTVYYGIFLVEQAHTTAMKTLLIDVCGKHWDQLPNGKNTMRTFWNSYCVAPWDCWSIGGFDAACCTPSQNCQESWHEHLKVARIPGMMKGSLAMVLQVALPQLVRMDGLMNRRELNFKVQV